MESPQKCELCGKSFSDEYELRSHLRAHADDNRQQTDEVIDGDLETAA
jgi:hypothetical protein